MIPSSASYNVVDKLCITIFNGKTLYVGGNGPGNYTSIQSAIDDAEFGDTIFVYDDSSPYNETLSIYKSINLFGEKKETTKIIGSSNGDVVNITVDWINLSDFTIQNSGSNGIDAGIEIHSQFNSIIGNIVMDNDCGIRLVDTSCNTISDNNISNNDYGVRFSTNCRNNTIIGNNIYSNKFRGIRLEASDGNTIMKNIVSNNGNGIRLEDSYYNLIFKNYISTNGNGLDLYSSRGTTVLENTFFNDGLQIYDSYQNIVSNNTVNGKLLVYMEGESNKVLDEAGQVILVNCENITVQNQEISDITYGIELWQTNNSLIVNNSLRSNYYDGIYLYSSKNNTIIGNTLTNNENGIALDYTDRNIITNNIISNNVYGLHLYESGNNINISSNNISNNIFGIQLFFSHDIIITNNNFSNNNFGISLWSYSSNIGIFDNKLINCGSGIWLNNARHNLILKNKFINCSSGIDFFQSDINNVQNNTFISGGIVIINSFLNIVTNNIVNGKPLVYYEEKSNIVIEYAGQVVLINCNNITVKNLDLSNVVIGIELLQTNYCQISKNTFVDNYYGSGFLNSNNNNFSNNKISNHRGLGIFLSSSNYNIISKNNIHVENFNSNRFFLYGKNHPNLPTIYFNDDFQFSEIIEKDRVAVKNIFEESQGIELGNSIGNIVKDNTIKNNKDGIIFVTSDFNTIEGNTIISNNRSGIRIINSEKNSIVRNTIRNSMENGIYFKDSNSNKINKNNFYLNYQNALFVDSYMNQWSRNYWNRPRLLPKLIFGKIEIGSDRILWINIDWRPALKPND
jgi:parallel beta-helix repeat protein